MNIFFISDLHLGHNNIIKFMYPDGTRLRPFDNIEQHDEFIINAINDIVSPRDRLVIVGDCVMNKNHMHKIGKINGKKTLVMGNHDPLDHTLVMPYFEKIAGALAINKFIVTHIPVHPNQLEYRFKANIHGHLHGTRVKLHVKVAENCFNAVDQRYFNVSVESLKYTPISLEEIKQYYAQYKNG